MHTLKPDDAFSIVIDTITPEFLEEPSSDKSRGEGGTSWVNPRKYMEGATHLDTTKHDLQGLEVEMKKVTYRRATCP